MGKKVLVVACRQLGRVSKQANKLRWYYRLQPWGLEPFVVRCTGGNITAVGGWWSVTADVTVSSLRPVPTDRQTDRQARSVSPGAAVVVIITGWKAPLATSDSKFSKYRRKVPEWKVTAQKPLRNTRLVSSHCLHCAKKLPPRTRSRWCRLSFLPAGGANCKSFFWRVAARYC